MAAHSVDAQESQCLMSDELWQSTEPAPWATIGGRSIASIKKLTVTQSWEFNE